MKKLFRKNQFVVSLLAVLIAVAGYLNYADKIAKKNEEPEDTYEAMYSEDDLLNSNDDIASLDVDSTQLDEQTDNAGTEDNVDEPGVAVLTSESDLSSFTIEARISREQIRSKNKETLLEVINNENIKDEEKQEAVDTMVSMTKNSELENSIETILKAKGYDDIIVSISEENVDVIANVEQVSDSDRAIIEDVITRKANVPVSNITIIPFDNEIGCK